MKVLLLVGFLILAVVFLSGCRIHSIVDLQNPEFPFELRPADVSGELLNKYSVGEVLVEPRIWHVDGSQTNYQVAVMFFSEATNLAASVESVAVSLNGNDMPYGAALVGSKSSQWKLHEGNRPFYACNVIGEPIARPEAEMKKARVDVSLVVVVTDEGGEVTTKQIDAYFVPKKRSYLE